MKRLLPALLISLAALLSARVGAEPLPALGADYAAESVLTLNGVQAMVVRVHHSRGRELRAASEGGLETRSLSRPDLGKEIDWTLPDHLATELPLDQAGPSAALLVGREARRLGTETVAGLDTVKYRLNFQGSDWLVWATADGIYVRLETAGAGQPVRLELRRIERGAQDPALFVPPPGLSFFNPQRIPDRLPPPK